MGCVRFWRYCFIACCVKIQERPWKNETFRHYEVRTGITSCNHPRSSLPEHKELADLDLERRPMISQRGTRSNIIYMVLEPYFSSYDYAYDEFEYNEFEYNDQYQTTIIPRLVYDFLGWNYVWI